MANYGRMWIFVVSIATVATIATADAACGGTFNTTTGSISFVPGGDPGPNKTCVWYVVAGNQSENQVMLDFVSLQVGLSDSLVIQAGNQSNSSVIANLTSVNAGPVTVLSSANVTTVTLTRGNSTTTTTQFSANFNTKGCVRTVKSVGGELVGPLYLNNSGTVDCVTTVETFPTQNLPVVTFQDFVIQSGYVTVKFGNDTMQALKVGNSFPDDAFGKAGDSKITVHFHLNSTAEKQTQMFKLVFFLADPACSGVRAIPDGGAVSLPLPQHSYPTRCHTLMTAPVNQTIQASVPKPFTGPTMFHNGGNAAAPIINVMLYGGKGNVSILTSSGSKMVVEASLGIGLGNTVLPPAMNFSSHKVGGLMNRSGSISLQGADVKGEKSVIYQVQARPGEKVQITLSKDTALKSNSSTVTVYDGFSMNLPLAVFSNKTVFYRLASVGPVLTVVVQSLKAGDVLKATLASFKQDCNVVSRGMSGVFSWNTNLNNTDGQCTWVLWPQIINSTGLQSDAVTMVSLQNLNLCSNNTVNVYNGLMASSPLLAVFTGNKTYQSLPTLQFPATAGLRVQWIKGNCSQPGNAMVARYWTQGKGSVCGQTSLQKTDSVSSPNYPNQYPLNTHCTWPLPAQNKSKLYLTVTSLDVSPPHQVTLQQRNGSKVTQLFNFSGSALPTTDLILDNVNMSVDFSSVAVVTGKNITLPGQGFNLQYKVLSCGGSLTNISGNFSSPAQPRNQTVECIWIIQLNQTKALKNIVNVTVAGYNSTSGGLLELRDGGSVRSPVIQVNWTRNHTVLSKTNLLWIRYSYKPNSTALKFRPVTGLKPMAGLNFTIQYSNFSCNASRQCKVTGWCIHPDWICNGVDDCGDGTDEQGCGAPIQPTTTPSPPAAQSKKKLDAYWVPVCLLFGVLFGILLTFLVPAIYHRLKQRSNYNEFHNDPVA